MFTVFSLTGFTTAHRQQLQLNFALGRFHIGDANLQRFAQGETPATAIANEALATGVITKVIGAQIGYVQ